MKRLLTISVLLILGTGFLSAQTYKTDMLYEKYRGEKGVISLWIPGCVMRMAASLGDMEDEEADLLRCIRSIRILTIEDTERYPEVNFVREANINPNRGKFKLMMQVMDGEEDVMIMARERNNKIRELLILVGGDENVMVRIKARIDADMIAALTQIADIDELDGIDLTEL